RPRPARPWRPGRPRRAGRPVPGRRSPDPRSGHGRCGGRRCPRRDPHGGPGVKIVLRNDVTGVGRKGDVLDVADGYARNYLLPKGHAMVATPGVEAQAEAMRRARQVRYAAEKAEAAELAKVLGGTTVKITAKAGREGKLFGSVSSRDIANAIATQVGSAVARRNIDISEPIKSLGTHSVVARLHTEVEVAITVE